MTEATGAGAAQAVPAPSTATAGEAQPDPRRWVALGIVLTASFMILLDISIVNVAIPSIRTNLGSTFAEVQFVLAGYQLAYAVVLITGGRLGDLHGRKRLFMIGMAGFTIASALCGLAVNPTMLVMSRVLQGLMASLMYPQVLSVIQVSFAPRERGTAFGIFGAIIGLATILGPLLGGLIIRDDITGGSWRFIFLVNVPVGIVSLTAAWRLMRENRAPRGVRLDLGGVAIASLGLFLLVYPLVEGRDADWAPWTFIFLILSAVVLAGFVVYERSVSRSGRAALVELRMFRMRAFSVGTLIAGVFFSGVPAFFFTFSVLLQLGLGFSALRAGLTTLPFALASAIASAMSVRLAPKLGKRILLVGSALLVLGTVGVMVTLRAAGNGVGGLELTPSLFVCGLGLGCVVAPLINIILAGVQGQDAGSASGVLTTVQQVGGALGIAVIGVIFFGLIGSRGGQVAHEQAPQLRAALVAAEPRAPAAAVDAQVSIFVRCYGLRAAAKDPQATPPGCPAPATGSGGAVADAYAGAAREANGTTFSDSLQLSLLFNVGVWTLSFFLALVLPSPRRGVAAAH